MFFFIFLQQKEAAILGKKVMVLDYVVPTPKGTSWGMTPPTIKLLYLFHLFSCRFMIASLSVIRSGRNVRQRWLHSKEAYAPDGSAAHSNPGCPQVWLGIRRNGWGMRILTRDVAEVKSHLTDCGSVCAVKHNWETMKTAINNYIGSLNWGYRVALRDKNVNYVNAYAEFVDSHKIKVSHCKNVQ